MEVVNGERRNEFRIKVIILIVAFFALLNEGVYIFSHRDVLSSYLLRSAKFVILKGNTDLGLFILTQGKIRRVDDGQFKKETMEYIKQAPGNHNIARVNYELAILAANRNLQNIVPHLLETSINRDPDFSFWRVELINYYLSTGRENNAEDVLNACLDQSHPRQHCLDYKKTDFDYKYIHEVGFLEEKINMIFESKRY